jgi:hypothetical protein
MSISQAVSQGPAGFNLAWPFLALMFGLGLAGYFGCLALLKVKLRRGRR